MRFLNHLKYLLFIAGIVLASCTNRPNKSITGEAFHLPDSLFVLKNLKNTLTHIDSATRKKFIEMDTIQKGRIVLPSILNDIPQINVKPDYIHNFMQGYFVSEQDTIGEFRPIIVGVSGDDYESLILIVLDKNNTPVSHLLLSGGLEAGPYESDSILVNKDRISIIKGNSILTYELYIREHTDTATENEPNIIDSVSYKSTILPNGEIETKKLDSIRIKRTYIPPREDWRWL